MNDMHSWVGAYVADALDDVELVDFERHLLGCATCRNEVGALRETMATAGQFHEVEPPLALRTSILEAISATPMLPVEEPLAPPRPLETAHGFGGRRARVATWMAAAALVLAVALGGVVVWQQTHLQSVQVAESQRTELLTAPDLEVSHELLDGGALTYFVSPGRGEALVASPDLPAPGPGRSWQVWVMQSGVPRSGAVIDSGGQVQAWVSDVAGGEALAVTNEPGGGSELPTGEVQALFEF